MDDFFPQNTTSMNNFVLETTDYISIVFLLNEKFKVAKEINLYLVIKNSKNEIMFDFVLPINVNDGTQTLATVIDLKRYNFQADTYSVDAHLDKNVEDKYVICHSRFHLINSKENYSFDILPISVERKNKACVRSVFLLF